VELKSVTASAYFSSDPANPDTVAHFHADVQMHAIFMGTPDPEGLMRQFISSEVASRANQWQRRNVTRFRSDEYDRLFHAAEVELDPVKRAALLKDVVHSGWESDLWRLAWWRA
jgi:peptide/nickel transport system substrate-binding protein